MKITLHALLSLCHQKLGENNYKRYFHDLLALLSFLQQREITFNEIIEQRTQIVHLNWWHFYRLIQKIVNGVPLPRIVKYIWWDEMKIFVHRHVFIPRVETLTLVSLVEKLINQHQLFNATVLDLCCGSGCISLAIKKRFNKVNCFLVDISKIALKNAKKNALLHGFEFNYLRSDFLDKIIAKKIRVDVIVCNPPYLDEDDVHLKYDPKKALYAKNHGTFFYERLFKELFLLPVFPKGIFLEIDPQIETKICQLFFKYRLPYQIRLHRDFYNNIRALSLIHF